MNITPTALPFSEQIDYFRKKINLPTATYLDIYGEAHDYAFVVAGAHTHEIMADFRTALDEVIEKGGTLEEFRQTFDNIVKKHSWEYNGGRNWRSRIIYDTNLYASYNHGRYQQQKELADVLPYWEYEHNDSTHPRKEHQAWDGLVLRADDPWWDRHYPPVLTAAIAPSKPLMMWIWNSKAKRCNKPLRLNGKKKSSGNAADNPDWCECQKALIQVLNTQNA